MKYTRQEILEALLEPPDTIEAELLAQAEVMAVGDTEVARALRECRQWSRVTIESVLPAPESSDAVFLTAVRERIDRTRSPRRARGIFGTSRLALASASAGVILMAVVLGGRVWLPGAAPDVLSDSAIVDYAAVADPVAVLDMETLAASEVSAESLAVYLDVASVTDVWESDENANEPLTDALLSLETQDIAEVISQLEATHFF